jgi:hypothetical protein
MPSTKKKKLSNDVIKIKEDEDDYIFKKMFQIEQGSKKI